MHLPPIHANITLSAGLAAAGAVLLLHLLRRVRTRRDRKRIQLELEKQHYKLVAAGRTRRTVLADPPEQAALRPSILRTYAVEFTDPEGLPGEGLCSITRAGMHWNEDGLPPGMEIAGANLPDYGQNWRG